MEFTVKSNKREEILDITSQVKEVVEKSEEAGKGKAVLIYTGHATCAIIINENYDPLVCEDVLDFLRKAVPAGKWKHDKIDDNADAHIKASLIGPGQLIPFENGKLGLGTWQGIGMAEFDGPRERTIIVKIL